MISKVILKNFKSIENEVFELTDFDLLVGSNNSGKSTLLQALAIWQYCVDEFKRTKRAGNRGIQIVLPNFTAISLPEFVLLWKDKTERKNVKNGEKTKPEFILIDIDVYWKSENNIEKNLTIQLRYQSPQSIYAIPLSGWDYFQNSEKSLNFPQIVYIPPFSALEAFEKWQDDGNIKQNVGKGQPGSVLRNLLFRVIDKPNLPIKQNENWQILKEKIQEWFGVSLNIPAYEKGISTMIGQSYSVGKKEFDIITAGSGFHQILTLLAFFYGYDGVTTLLFDEPDAHLHINLQRQILNHFKKQKKIQFLIATHSEEFIRNVEVQSIISMLSGKPKRINSTENIIKAMSDVDNMVVLKTKLSPFILYLEGEDDARILTAWASILGKLQEFNKYHICYLSGGNKSEMKKKSDLHFNALKQINENVQRIVLFDYDSDASFHPDKTSLVVKEWKRKNIENYLLVPDAWKNSIFDALNTTEMNLFSDNYIEIIDLFFEEQSLTLPKKFDWTNIKANIFEVIDGKKILFENSDSLFQRLMKIENLKINREKVAYNMTKDMIHHDILDFFNSL